MPWLANSSFLFFIILPLRKSYAPEKNHYQKHRQQTPVNNILFPIFGYTEMTMEDVPENSSARSNLEEVFKAANRAKDLVQQILTFSRQNDQKLRWTDNC